MSDRRIVKRASRSGQRCETGDGFIEINVRQGTMEYVLSVEIDDERFRIPYKVGEYIHLLHQELFSLSTRLPKGTVTEGEDRLKFVGVGGGSEDSYSVGRVRKKR